MLDLRLQIILLITTVTFFVYIINLVRNKKLELHYTLTWLISTAGLIVITIMPGALRFISEKLNVKEPVNTLFLVMIFFLILIILSLTKAISKAFFRVTTLTQEIGLIKLEIERLKKSKQ